LTVDALRAILAVSTYEQERQGYGPTPEQQDQVRQNLGGNLSPLPQTKTRWYLKELETAQYNADNGDLELASMLYRSMRRDGVFAGLLSQCTDGLVRLPKRFFGDPAQCAELEPHNGSRSVFDEMFPPQELALLAADGRMLGVGVAEMLPVQGRDYPVMCRLDPQWLRYRWNEGRWYYMSVTGPIPVTPGDGRWILHVPGGRIAPWNSGMWQACGRAWIHKEHALSFRSNWEAKLANPARVGEVPQACNDEMQQAWFQKIAAWSVDTVFVTKPGYSVKLLESNGRGYESFRQTVECSDNEYMICLAGQVVTTTGGTGFANADIHRSIRADIIKSIADSLSYTINTQGLPVWVLLHYGEAALTTRATVEWDVTPAKDRLAEANTLVTFANALNLATDAHARYGKALDIEQLDNEFGVPCVTGGATGGATPGTETPSGTVTTSMTPTDLSVFFEIMKSVGLVPVVSSIEQIAKSMGIESQPISAISSDSRVQLTPTDVAKVVTVDEARASQGLEPIGDDRGNKTVFELANEMLSPESA
jgi:hypothetical protein